MKTFRRRVLTAALVLFALALGVALGAGPLSGPGEVLPGLPHRGQSNSAVASFESEFVDETSGQLVRGKLDGHAAIVLQVEGADDEQVRRVRAALKDAGADVIGTRKLKSKLVDTANRQFADSVARQSAGDAVDKETDSYRRIGTALARAVVSKSKGRADATAQSIWAAFAQGGLVSGRVPPTYADVVVIVANGDRSAPASTVLAGLARAFDAAAAGTVVAGPSSSSLDGGAVATIRSGTAGVSTVDVTDSAAGGLLVVLAAQRDAGGKPGAWGTPRSADGPFPSAA